MLPYDLKNKESTAEAVKKKVPIKKVFVKVDDSVILKLDSKTLEHYGDNVSQKDKNYISKSRFQCLLNNLASIGLFYRGTGDAAKKPYVEFYGGYKR